MAVVIEMIHKLEITKDLTSKNWHVGATQEPMLKHCVHGINGWKIRMPGVAIDRALVKGVSRPAVDNKAFLPSSKCPLPNSAYLRDSRVDSARRREIMVGFWREMEG
jgi:hypothetical protein